MEKTIFETERIPFKERCKKDIKIKIFAFLFFASIPIFSSSEFNIISILFILFFLFVFLFITYNESKEFVYKIEFENEKINIFGSNFDNDWIEIFEIKKVNIQIRKHVSKTGSVIGYTIIFKSGKKKITINRLYNWNNFDLHQIFTEFKKIKGEKIIIDEKSLIDGIKKKAEDEDEWEQ
ncbi:hypothetical protein GON26_00780 [Flavobacterium sp. GA093]|uniref:Uncharacterized protein n=1 Tax=Flavobacterium hydrocarbonoxydans TaxID=2683249 RepID=A0A6I4NMK9_9FLAO|nr:hypothetical protein [Flavobacterium hydrocarbonoxydans]MWB92889.1 hypothetical protein [Flavobacterium hydrocarbonoxydans]